MCPLFKRLTIRRERKNEITLGWKMRLGGGNISWKQEQKETVKRKRQREKERIE